MDSQQAASRLPYAASQYKSLQINQLDDIPVQQFSQRQPRCMVVSSQSTRLKSQGSSRNTSSKFFVRPVTSSEQRKQFCLNYLQKKQQINGRIQLPLNDEQNAIVKHKKDIQGRLSILASDWDTRFSECNDNSIDEKYNLAQHEQSLNGNEVYNTISINQKILLPKSQQNTKLFEFAPQCAKHQDNKQQGQQQVQSQRKNKLQVIRKVDVINTKYNLKLFQYKAQWLTTLYQQKQYCQLFEQEQIEPLNLEPVNKIKVILDAMIKGAQVDLQDLLFDKLEKNLQQNQYYNENKYVHFEEDKHEITESQCILQREDNKTLSFIKPEEELLDYNDYSLSENKGLTHNFSALSLLSQKSVQTNNSKIVKGFTSIIEAGGVMTLYELTKLYII